MTVYKIQKKLVVLLGILFLMSIFFSYSVYVTDFSGGSMAVCAILIIFLGLNLAVFLSKSVSVENGVVHQTTLYGKKEINLKELEEIGVVNLRWRIILILSDPHKFVFISSLYENFEEFIEFLKIEAAAPSIAGLSKVSSKTIRNKNLFLGLMMLAGSLFFLLSGFYNLLYR